ncbi:hypothetical protein [Virgisporangium aurantiacum]|uniref:Uncharacterized protein n=1 Tax=Virgisporangium aurantiacum TaxID=175570 RepID=A0A8J4E7S8_9ACTN|nr:hypothetical protein [Virgisporangium aurantiacum]GIJ62082.1 hypothetical protein Vau01_095980 [Virgisporangium aurantiacum]
MKAEVAYTPLLAAARALKPYSTPANTLPRWRASSRLLHLHADGHTVTMTASTGDETATVALPGAVPDSSHDGGCALPPEALINALAVIKPAGRAAARATVTMDHHADRLHLTVADGPTIDLDTATPPEPAPAIPAAVGQLVTEGGVVGWCDLVAGAATAASREPARRELAVVRLHRDYPRTVLVVEATDTRRVHRGIWRGPGSDLGRDLGTEPMDVRIPVEAAVRAVRLLRALDPTGHLRVRADDRLVTWRTDRVHVSARIGGGQFPDLEKLREDVLDDATTRFTVERTALLSVLDTAHRLTAPARQPRIRLERPDPGVLDVVVLSPAGTAVYTGQLPVTAASGPTYHMLLNPVFVRDAVGFLDGDTVTVHSSPDWLPTYLAGARRHAIVMRVRG